MTSTKQDGAAEPVTLAQDPVSSLLSEVAALRKALEGLMQLESRGRVMPIGAEWDAARAALKETP